VFKLHEEIKLKRFKPSDNQPPVNHSEASRSNSGQKPNT
jgi:hypothetical protein